MVYNTGERKDMAGDLERTVSHKAVLLFYFPCVLCVVDCVSVSQLFQLGVECTLEKKERERWPLETFRLCYIPWK